jgi:tagaturonate reductase
VFRLLPALRLRALVTEQTDRWGWTDAGFRRWLNEECQWVNNLVDRIVSGMPAEHPLKDSDPLLTVTEPYQFWAVEDKPGTAFLNHPAIHRVPDVRPFGLRKVRILNGAHTAMLAYCRKYRPEIQLVREAVTDPQVSEWLRGLLFEEIVPTVADRVPDAEGFAHQTLERFANPFLDHKLSAIALHHDKKVPVRLVPTRDEFTAKFGHVPARLEEAIRTPVE